MPCDTCGDTTPHTLVGPVELRPASRVTARASVRLRADRRNDPREAWGPQGDTHFRPPERRGFGPVHGVTGHRGRGRRDGPQHEAPSLIPEYGIRAGKGLNVI